jgi:hypothetical protein
MCIKTTVRSYSEKDMALHLNILLSLGINIWLISPFSKTLLFPKYWKRLTPAGTSSSQVKFFGIEKDFVIFTPSSENC